MRWIFGVILIFCLLQNLCSALPIDDFGYYDINDQTNLQNNSVGPEMRTLGLGEDQQIPTGNEAASNVDRIPNFSGVG